MTPKFILVDEWAALMAKIDRDYSLQSELMEYLSQLVLEGRQAGIFIIFAMQRPDGEFIKTALRDNFMKRLSVGHLESTGYDMMFGDANKPRSLKSSMKSMASKLKDEAISLITVTWLANSSPLTYLSTKASPSMMPTQNPYHGI